MKKILITEDDIAILELIELYLDKDKYKVIFAMNGEEALEKFHKEHPDLIILDINMPVKNGIDVCKEIREISLVPIIFVTSRDESKDVVEGLMAGADDYVTKPFDCDVLLARIEANLRYKKDYLAKKDIVNIDSLEVDYRKHRVTKYGKEIILHPRELSLLLYMTKHTDEVLSPQKIYEEVWGADSLGDTLTVSVHISRIRKKIEENPKNPKIIKTVKGKGYIIANS